MANYCYARGCENNQEFDPVCMYDKVMPCRVLCDTCKHKCKSKNYACDRFRRKQNK